MTAILTYDAICTLSFSLPSFKRPEVKRQSTVALPRTRRCARLLWKTAILRIIQFITHPQRTLKLTLLVHQAGTTLHSLVTRNARHLHTIQDCFWQQLQSAASTLLWDLPTISITRKLYLKTTRSRELISASPSAPPSYLKRCTPAATSSRASLSQTNSPVSALRTSDLALSNSVFSLLPSSVVVKYNAHKARQEYRALRNIAKHRELSRKLSRSIPDLLSPELKRVARSSRVARNLLSRAEPPFMTPPPFVKQLFPDTYSPPSALPSCRESCEDLGAAVHANLTASSPVWADSNEDLQQQLELTIQRQEEHKQMEREYRDSMFGSDGGLDSTQDDISSLLKQNSSPFSANNFSTGCSPVSTPTHVRTSLPTSPGPGVSRELSNASSVTFCLPRNSYEMSKQSRGSPYAPSMASMQVSPCSYAQLDVGSYEGSLERIPSPSVRHKASSASIFEIDWRASVSGSSIPCLESTSGFSPDGAGMGGSGLHDTQGTAHMQPCRSSLHAVSMALQSIMSTNGTGGIGCAAQAGAHSTSAEITPRYEGSSRLPTSNSGGYVGHLRKVS